MTVTVERILDLAKKRGVKLAYLNELVGGYRGKATDWKNGKSSPSEKEIQIIAEYFDVTADYLRGSVGDPRVELIPADPIEAKKYEDEQNQARQEAWGKIHEAQKKIASLESPVDPKEALRQRLINEGIIPSDRPMTNEEWNAILTFAESLMKRNNE